MCILAALLLVSFDQLLAADRRVCPAEDYCLPVPADVCNNSHCLPMNEKFLKEINEFAAQDLHTYTWNMMQDFFVNFCPMRCKFVQTVTAGNKIKVSANFIFQNGPYCNGSSTKVFDFTGEPGPSIAGFKYLITAHVWGGEQFEACYTYFEPGKAAVFRLCRAKPTNGQACASVMVVEPSGNSDRKNLLQFLTNSGVTFPQKINDCV